MAGALNTRYGRGRLITNLLGRDTIANLITASPLRGNGSRVAVGAAVFGSTALGAAQTIVICGGQITSPLWAFDLSLSRPSHSITLEEVGSEITAQLGVFSGTTTQALVLWEVVFEPEGY